MRLATWVWIGAAALACVAGMVNVVGFLGFEHQAITHLTGTTSLLGAALVSGDAPRSSPCSDRSPRSSAAPRSAA